MNQKELKELIEFLIEKDIAEFELERGDVKVRIKRGVDVSAAPPAEARYSSAPQVIQVEHTLQHHQPRRLLLPRLLWRRPSYGEVSHWGHVLQSHLPPGSPPFVPWRPG